VPLGPLGLDMPVAATLDREALALAALAALCLFRLKLGVVPTLAVAAVSGLAVKSLMG
jgi:chromate transporter